MSWKSIVLGAIIACLGVSPLAAGKVSDQQRRACEIKADNVVPALRMPRARGLHRELPCRCLGELRIDESNKDQK